VVQIIWQATKARKVSDIACNPSLAPTGFFIFGLLKRKLRGIFLTDEEDFISRVLVIWDAIPEYIVIPPSVDMTWIKRLLCVIKNTSEYYSKYEGNCNLTKNKGFIEGQEFSIPRLLESGAFVGTACLFAWIEWNFLSFHLRMLRAQD
jgi:hypothetical protein